MRLLHLVAPVFAANTYILFEDDRALLVDPGAGHKVQIERALSDNGLELAAVLLTHGHPDHVWDAAQIAAALPVYLPGPDMYRMEDPLSPTGGVRSQLTHLVTTPWQKPRNLQPLPPEMLSSGYELVPGVPLRAVPAPGHTEGSTIFLGQGPLEGLAKSDLFALAGDVIFAGSVGRADLPGGDSQQMMHTLRTLQNIINPETLLLPGHGPITSMGTENNTNPYFRQARIDG
ncbi:MAG: MBL fold metallo-hydrolase [Actinomycetaceae bacterium]|nr:MBL fold metallo-hydrolase [Actinomycetaceae bacterium]